MRRSFWYLNVLLFLQLWVVNCIGAKPGPDTLLPVIIFYEDTLCSNQSIIINGTIYNSSMPSGTEVIPNGAANGCDSIININLSFLQAAESTIDHPICEGDTVFINGTAYHSGFFLGTETVEGGAANGCDSIIRVELKPIASPFSILQDTLCPDGSYTINGTVYDQLNPNGLETLPGASYLGCDSLVLIELFFREIWVFAGADEDIVLGDEVCFEALFGLNRMSFSWSPLPPCINPSCTTFCQTADVLEDFSYVLTATDVNGCVVSDTVSVRVSDESRIFTPNVFNPDLPPPNNTFWVGTDQSIDRIKQMIIADRWGNIVFLKEDIAPNDPGGGWDGTYRGEAGAPGVYTYHLVLERIDGSAVERSGTITLLR